MFSKIMVPVDLVHRDTIAKAVDVACNMAHEYNAEIYFVSVSGELPSEIASSAGEYGQILEEFTAHKAKQYSITAHAVNLKSPDPSAEVNSRLLKATEEIGADLVIMASHEPGIMDHIFSSHGGHMASYAKVSVFVVR
ncbi:universal stress protein [Ostreibacterium oceani]|uniref:Universal stress protein n=1 Tax=Ostreibacterium oceani TaxID=2654998 RepID=A0A6N7EXL4_9GAMM|nr:universal stress protein [Ostreibacterium oceani]MPV86280.1 universal stress protein [Ostreibacterium oceani]